MRVACPLLLALALSVPAGCSPLDDEFVRHHPLPPMTWAEADRALGEPASLPLPARVLVVGRPRGGGRLAEPLAARLRASPAIASATVAHFTPGEEFERLSFDAARAIARANDCDALVVVSQLGRQERGKNVLAASYALVVPVLFAPGESVAFETRVEATLIDPETGAALRTVAATARAEDGFVRRFRRDAAGHELEAELGRSLVPEIAHGLETAIVAIAARPPHLDPDPTPPPGAARILLLDRTRFSGERAGRPWHGGTPLGEALAGRLARSPLVGDVSTAALFPADIGPVSPSGDPLTEDARRFGVRHRAPHVLVLRSSVRRDSGFNPLGLLYLGLVTIPLVPGRTIEVDATYEVDLVDTRTGAVLFTARESASASEWFVRLTREDLALDDLERELEAGVVDRLAAAIEVRLARVVATAAPGRPPCPPR